MGLVVLFRAVFHIPLLGTLSSWLMISGSFNSSSTISCSAVTSFLTLNPRIFNSNSLSLRSIFTINPNAFSYSESRYSATDSKNSPFFSFSLSRNYLSTPLPFCPSAETTFAFGLCFTESFFQGFGSLSKTVIIVSCGTVEVTCAYRVWLWFNFWPDCDLCLAWSSFSLLSCGKGHGQLARMYFFQELASMTKYWAINLYGITNDIKFFISSYQFP